MKNNYFLGYLVLSLSACAGAGTASQQPVTPPNGGRVSAVTPPLTSAVDERSYEAFVSSWMDRLDPSMGEPGSFAEYSTKPLPSPTGSIETMEALEWLNIWCKRHGATPGTVDGGQGLQRAGVVNGERAAVGRTVGYCVDNGHIAAALAVDPIRGDAGVSLSLSHFSQRSLSALNGGTTPSFTMSAAPLPAVPPPAAPTPAANAPPPSAAAVTAPAAPPEAAKIRLENFSGLQGIREYIYEQAPGELRTFLVKGEYAVFADALAFDASSDGTRYCWGMVGLTRPQPDDRNPRIPAGRSSGFYAASKGEEESACKATALRQAFVDFFSTTTQGLLEDASQVDDAGGIRKPRAADPTTVRTFWGTQSGFDPGDYVAGNVPREFTQTFDYRRLQLVALSTETRLKSQLVCFGLVGVTTTSPHDRNPRWPSNRRAIVRHIPISDASGPGAGDRCEGEALKAALAELLDQSWDGSGLLDGLNATREEGVTPVRDAPKKKTAAARAPEPSRAVAGPTKAQSTSVTSLRYECFNGDCTRIYPNGKRERFQAPRCYDPFKQTWVWKPEGC